MFWLLKMIMRILLEMDLLKDGQFPFIDEFNLKTLQPKRLYTSTYKDKKEDLLEIEDFKKGKF